MKKTKTKTKIKIEDLFILIVILSIASICLMSSTLIFLYVFGNYDIYSPKNKLITTIATIIFLIGIRFALVVPKAWNNLLGKKKNKNRV